MASNTIFRSAWRSLRRLPRDESGATAIEYGLMVALISVAIMATLFAVGADIKTVLYGKILDALAAM
jgi:pilus assembly protein Flp/PilA